MARKARNIVAMLMLTLAASTPGSAAPAKAARKGITTKARPRTVALQVQSSTSNVYGGLWQVGQGYSTNVVLKNKDPHNPLAVNLILYSTTGQIAQTAQVQLGPNAAQSIALSSIVNTQDGLLHSGGLALAYDSAAVGVSGVVELTNISTGASVILPIGSGYRFDTENALYASWLLADNATDGKLTLFNASGQPMTVTPWLTVQGSDTSAASITLAANETKTLGLRDLLGQTGLSAATQGAITLVYSGTTHGLQPTLLLSNNTTGYWLAPRFQGRHSAPPVGAAPSTSIPALTGNDGRPLGTWLPGVLPRIPAVDALNQNDVNSPNGSMPGAISVGLRGQSGNPIALDTPSLTGSAVATTGSGSSAAAGQTRWQFPALKLQWAGGASNNPLHGYALLTNGTKGTLSLELEAHFVGGANGKEAMQKVQLPVVTLAPLNTQVLDLSQFVSNGAITGNPSRVALVASHVGMPGDVGITLFSVTPGNSLVFHSAGVILSSATVDISYWRVANKKESPRGLLNPTATAAQVQVTAFYPTPMGIESYQMPVVQIPPFGSARLKFGQITRVPDQRGVVAPPETRQGMTVAVLVPQPQSTSGTAGQVLGSSALNAVAETGICEGECGLAPSGASAGAGAAIGVNGGNSSALVSSLGVSPAQANITTTHQHVHFNENQNENQNCFPPQIDQITPPTGAAGKSVDVVISGNYFPKNPSASMSGGTSVTVTSASETSIAATLDIPRDSSTGDQQVTVTSKWGQGTGTFYVFPPGVPGIEAIDPNQGNAGSTVHVLIQGGHFAQGDTISVSGGIGATIDQVVDDANINATFQIPAGASLGPQQVVITDQFGGSSKPAIFTVNPQPPLSITAVLPSPWQAGTSFPVTVTGTGFGTAPSLQITDPNGAVGYTTTFASPTQIQASVTVGTTASENASVTVTFGGDSGSSAAFRGAPQIRTMGRAQKSAATALGTAPSATVTVPIVSGASAPVITGISPARGKAGTTVNVTIDGRNFPASPSVNVSGGIGTQITGSSATVIGVNFILPAGSSAVGPQQVTVSGSTGQSNPVTFTVDSATAPPVITGISPADAPAGSTVNVTIEGGNFPANPAVTVGAAGSGISVNVTSSDNSTISAKFSIPWSTSVLGPQQVTVSGPNGRATTTFTVDVPRPLGIEMITPPQATAGTTLQVLIEGGPNYLHVTGISVSGGIGATIDQVVDDNNIKATFQIPLAVAYGPHNVVLSDLFGSGNPGTFTVLAPPGPAITDVEPRPWQAGWFQQPVIITGTNFGTSPSVSITDDDGLLIYTPAVPFETDPATGQVLSIQTDVSIDVSAPFENAHVDVINNDGSGAAAGALSRRTGVGATRGPASRTPVVSTPVRPTPGPGSRAATAGAVTTSLLESPPYTVQIDPIAKPAIQIMFQNKDIANKEPQDVYIGQQIKLTAVINLPPGSAAIQSEAWSDNGIPPGNVVGGYTPTAADGHDQALQPTTCATTTTCDLNTFYWVDQANGRQLTFSYTLSNGSQASATATFNVAGPTNPNVSVTTTAVNIDGTFPPQLRFGRRSPGVAGISFSASATRPAQNPGVFQWIQLITSDKATYNKNGGYVTCNFNGFVNDPRPELDNSYPYVTATETTTNDNPSSQLDPHFGEQTRRLGATMYLLWDPALKADGSSGCQTARTMQNPIVPPATEPTFTSTPSNCASIPIPLGSVDWSENGDAINTLSIASGQDGTTWALGCGRPSGSTMPAFTASSVFPVWTKVELNGNQTYTCTPVP